MNDRFEHDFTADAVRDLANAITPLGALGATTPNGGRVASLTEAMIYIAENLGRIADALEKIGDAA